MSPLLRRPRLVVLAVVAALVLAAAWLAWTALSARASLERARTALPQVQSAVTAGDSSSATGLLRSVRSDADSAFRRTHDPVWFVAAHIPLLGQPLATVRGLTAAVRDLTDTGLPALASVAVDLKPAALRPEPDRLDVDRLARASGPISLAAQTLASQRTAVAELAPSWLPQVADARMQLLDQLDPLVGSSHKAAVAAELLPSMLGKDGPRRYFLGFQNPAEARGTGGLLGAFAVLEADRGRVQVERIGPNYQLPALPAVVPGLDPAFTARYRAQGATALWVNANVTPDFPEAARAWLAMWRAGTGQQLDGALGMDHKVLAAVVRGTGPLPVPELGEVSADRVEPLVLRDQYQLTGSSGARKDVMVGVGSAVVDALLGGRADPQRLVSALGDGGLAGHVMVASRQPAEQALLRRNGLSGQVDPTSAPFAEAVVVNAAGGKLDSYLDTALDYRATRCTSTARTAVVTVRLHNAAPASGLPKYVTTRADRPPYATVPGQNRTDLRVLTTLGARLSSARLDGKVLILPVGGQLPKTLPANSANALLAQTTQAGRPSFGLTLELPPGATRTLELTLAEPASSLPPELPRQPLARPTHVSADVSACRPA